MKILHSADWHLDSPLQGFLPAQAEELRNALLGLPGRIAGICRREGCDLILLSGDLFDGAYTKESLDALRASLEEAAVPVFIAPGNHDPLGAASPWRREVWPENVFIFSQMQMHSVAIPALDCRIYGAGYTAMDCPPLLEGFHADGGEKYAIGLIHADPTQTSSPYCPVTNGQVRASGLDYLALGHIHKGGAFRAGRTLCAWPGCPMGRGYDEQGEKGVLIVTLDGEPQTRFVKLDMPQFYDWQTEVGQTPAAALDLLLPPVGNRNFYRVTLTGQSEPPDLPALAAQFSRFPNLTLRDRTTPPADLWGCAGEDTLEGIYFQTLRQRMEHAGEPERSRILLAAQIARRILDGEEVKLP